MFESLKEKIANNKEYNPPAMHLFYEDIANIEKAVPESLFKPRMKGYIKRAARILWLRYLTGRDIESSKELFGREWWLVHEWFTGISGSTDDRELNEILNLTELTTWMAQNAPAIWQLAEQIKTKETLKRKAKRQAKKQTDIVPF